MKDLNEQWMIEDSPSMEKSNNKLKGIWWCLGLNSLRKTAFIGFLICASPLFVPPLVFLSAFAVAFFIPFGFVLAVYGAIDELMSISLHEKSIPFYSEFEYVSSYDLIKREGYEQDYDLEEVEGDIEIEEEVELGTTVIGRQLGISETSIDVEEVIVDEFEEIGCNDRKKTHDRHIEQQVTTQVISSTMFRFGSGEREEFGKEKEVEDESVVPSTPSPSPFLSWGGSDYDDLEQLLSLTEAETPDGPVELEGDSDPIEEESGDVEPGEVVKATMQMVEVVRTEGKLCDNLEQSMEEATSLLPAASAQVHGAVLDLEHLKLLSIDGTTRLPTIDEQLAADKENKRDDALPPSPTLVEIERTTSTKVEHLYPYEYKGIEDGYLQ